MHDSWQGSVRARWGSFHRPQDALDRFKGQRYRSPLRKWRESKLEGDRAGKRYNEGKKRRDE